MTALDRLPTQTERTPTDRPSGSGSRSSPSAAWRPDRHVIRRSPPRLRRRSPPQRHPRQTGQFRRARRAAGGAVLPALLLARRRRGDQLPPLLRDQRAGRDPPGGCRPSSTRHTSASSPDRRRRIIGRPHRPSRRALGPGRVLPPPPAGTSWRECRAPRERPGNWSGPRRTRAHPGVSRTPGDVGATR